MLRRHPVISSLLWLCALQTAAVSRAADEPAAPPPVAVAVPPLALDLDGCVAYALSNALDLAQQRLALENVGLATLIARQKYAPSLSAQTSHLDRDQDRTLADVTAKQRLPGDLELTAGVASPDLADESEGSDLGYSVSLSKRILGGGSIAEANLEIDGALLDELVEANRYASFRRDLVRRVLRQYYQIHRARQTLVIRQRRLEMSRTNVEHAIAREDPLDIANAQLEVPVSEAAATRSQRDIDTALDAMKQLLGAPLEAPLDVVGQLAFTPVAIDVEADIRRSAESHEDVLNQRLAIRKMALELPVRKDRVWPAVDVSAGAVREAGTATGDEWAFETRLSASWTLFAAAERAKVRQLVNQLADEQLGLELLLRERTTTLRSLARRLEEALRQVDIGRQSLALATRRAALYSDRWENGAIDILEYIRSQNDLEERRVDLVDLEITYLETLADYRVAVGDPVQGTGP